MCVCVCVCVCVCECYCCCYFITFCEFFTPTLAYGLSWRLRDYKCSQVSKTLLTILGDLNTAAVWMVSTHPRFPNLSGYRDHSKCANYNWHHRYRHVPQRSLFSGNNHVLVSLFAFFDFQYVV